MEGKKYASEFKDEDITSTQEIIDDLDLPDDDDNVEDFSSDDSDNNVSLYDSTYIDSDSDDEDIVKIINESTSYQDHHVFTDKGLKINIKVNCVRIETNKKNI